MADTGRPSDYNTANADAICEYVSDGKSIREIAEIDGMPSKATIFRWLSVHPEFQDQYARAKEAQAELIADEMLDISDDATNDWMARNGEDNAGWQANGEAIQRSRLRVDTRKWLLGKLKPKKYGEKVDVDMNHGVQDSLLDLMSRIDGKSRDLPQE